MKYLLLPSLLFAVISCKKSDSESELPLSSFTFGGKMYTAKTYSPGNGDTPLWGTGVDSPSISFYFIKTAPKEGTYKIAGANDTAKGVVVIAYKYKPAGSAFTETYTSTAFSNAVVTVRMDGGYRVYSLPKVWAKRYGVSNDSAEISAYLKEWL